MSKQNIFTNLSLMVFSSRHWRLSDPDSLRGGLSVGAAATKHLLSFREEKLFFEGGVPACMSACVLLIVVRGGRKGCSCVRGSSHLNGPRRNGLCWWSGTFEAPCWELVFRLRMCNLAVQDLNRDLNRVRQSHYGGLLSFLATNNKLLQVL